MVAFPEKYRGVIPRSVVAENIVRGLARVCVPEITVQGDENLPRVRELVSAGMKIRMVANHRSHIDAPSLDDALWREGYGDLAQRLVFLVGKRIFDHPVLRLLASGVSYIPVWPRTEEAVTPKDRDRKWKITKITSASVAQVDAHGGILVIFPEGTRSRDGSLHPAVPDVAHYLKDIKDRNIFVVPVGIRDTEKAMPIGELPRPPVFRRREDQVPVTIIFGEPMPNEMLFANIDQIPPKERNATVMARVMNEIDVLLRR